jgi:hypothetical protein
VGIIVKIASLCIGVIGLVVFSALADGCYSYLAPGGPYSGYTEEIVSCNGSNVVYAGQSPTCLQVSYSPSGQFSESCAVGSSDTGATCSYNSFLVSETNSYGQPVCPQTDQQYYNGLCTDYRAISPFNTSVENDQLSGCGEDNW